MNKRKLSYCDVIMTSLSHVPEVRFFSPGQFLKYFGELNNISKDFCIPNIWRGFLRFDSTIKTEHVLPQILQHSDAFNLVLTDSPCPLKPVVHHGMLTRGHLIPFNIYALIPWGSLCHCYFTLIIWWHVFSYVFSRICGIRE